MQEIIYNKGWNLISFTENLNLNEIIIYFQGKYIEQTLYSYNTSGYYNVIDNVEIGRGYWIKLSDSLTVPKSESVLNMEDKLVKKIRLLKTNKDYRLGDIVFHKGWPPKYDEWKNSQENILNNKEFNNTILKEYIDKNNINIVVPSQKKIGLIFSDIIEKKITEKNYLVPKNDELVIHLRTGDVAVLPWFLNKPYLKLIQESINKYNIKKIMFVTCFHYGNNTLNKDGGKGKTLFVYKESVHQKNINKLTNLFKEIILKFPFLKIDVLSSIDVDRDFVYMCKAKHLILDGGGFSKLIGIIQNVIKN